MVQNRRPKVEAGGGSSAIRNPQLQVEQGRAKITSIDAPDFFDQIKEQLRNRPTTDKNVLLNIPIWGWTGDGKTCALLTLIHYCDPAQHPLGFALVTNALELQALENATDEYKGLNLASIASSTIERLRSLSELFIDNDDWPPGTDEPSAYVLAIRNIAATLGYVIFPDR